MTKEIKKHESKFIHIEKRILKYIASAFLLILFFVMIGSYYYTFQVADDYFDFSNGGIEISIFIVFTTFLVVVALLRIFNWLLDNLWDWCAE